MSAARVTRNHLRRRAAPVLDPLLLEDMSDAISLAKRSYAAALTDACLQTLRFHEACLRFGLDDGRRLFKYVCHGEMVGVCGLHRYVWGPSDCAWLSWFFLDPLFRSGTHGYRMLSSLIQVAVQDGLGRLYVETPSDDVAYAQASAYLKRLGFVQQAVLPDYYRPGVDMMVFVLAIAST